MGLHLVSIAKCKTYLMTPIFAWSIAAKGINYWLQILINILFKIGFTNLTILPHRMLFVSIRTVALTIQNHYTSYVVYNITRWVTLYFVYLIFLTYDMSLDLKNLLVYISIVSIAVGFVQSKQKREFI